MFFDKSNNNCSFISICMGEEEVKVEEDDAREGLGGQRNNRVTHLRAQRRLSIDIHHHLRERFIFTTRIIGP